MLKKIALAIGVLIVIILVYAATRPDSFRVERSAVIGAPPEEIFTHLEDLHQWAAWSPWERKDPAMKRTHSGAARGTGAVYAWDGNDDVGQGSMEIIETVPPSRLVIRLDFIKPFEAHNIVEFALRPEGGSTNVVWSIHGPSPYVSKLMGLFFDMDALIGKDFEDGLARLKTLAEA
ncbi:MAG: SRPBCC family protein [Gammaproteobacteria bacterium]|nr:SRPBCC family protein [Gammaproteobacteria bacterium]